MHMNHNMQLLVYGKYMVGRRKILCRCINFLISHVKILTIGMEDTKSFDFYISQVSIDTVFFPPLMWHMYIVVYL